MKPIKLDEETREKLALWLCQEIDLGIEDRQSLKQRWDINERYYRNDPAPWSNRYIKAEMTHYPLVQPKGDALRDNILDSILSKEPKFLVKLRGSSQRLENIEQAIDFFWDMGSCDDALKKAWPIVFSCGLCIIQTTFDVNAQGFPANNPSL